jgi:hypothetical protein
LVLPAVVRFGVTHPRLWALVPFLLLAGGVYALATLADHYAWGNGTTFLIGALMLVIFVMVIGPIAVLPRALKKATTDGPQRPAAVNLMEALRASVEEAGGHVGSVSTREGQRPRYQTRR